VGSLCSASIEESVGESRLTDGIMGRQRGASGGVVRGRQGGRDEVAALQGGGMVVVGKPVSLWGDVFGFHSVMVGPTGQGVSSCPF
jgi:hypothetical protein